MHYLVAPAGVPNWGDEVIIASWLRFLAAACPDDTVVVDCHSPGKASVLLRGLHPHLIVTDTIWHLVERVTAEIMASEIPDPEQVTASQLDELMLRVRTMVGNPGLVADYSSNIHLLNNADTVHIVGGGYLNDLWPHHCAVVSAVRAVARRQREAPEPNPLFLATGQGLVPQRQGRIVEELLAADVVTVRDAASYDLCVARAEEKSANPAVQEAHVPEIALVADDSWLGLATSAVAEKTHLDVLSQRSRPERVLKGVARRMRLAVHGECTPPPPETALPQLEEWFEKVRAAQTAEASGMGAEASTVTSTEPTVTPVVQHRFPFAPAPASRRTILCVQSDLVGDKDDLWQWVQEVLQKWQVTGPELLVVEALPYGDYEVWRRVVQAGFPGASFMPFDQVWAEGLPVGEGVRWLSTRFHPHLLASAAGCAGLALDAGAADYYTVKHGSVQAAGSRWEVRRISEGLSEGAPLEVPIPHYSFHVSRCETNMWSLLQLAEAAYLPKQSAK